MGAKGTHGHPGGRDGQAAHGQGDRRLAGGQHDAELSADRAVLRTCTSSRSRASPTATWHRASRATTPVAHKQLTADEIARAEKDPTHRLQLLHNPAAEGEEVRRGPRYTPLSKRQDRPAAILWLVKFHPELTDAQISKLVGTTKPTIQSIRDRSPLEHPEHPADRPGGAGAVPPVRARRRRAEGRAEARRRGPRDVRRGAPPPRLDRAAVAGRGPRGADPHGDLGGSRRSRCRAPARSSRSRRRTSTPPRASSTCPTAATRTKRPPSRARARARTRTPRRRRARPRAGPGGRSGSRATPSAASRSGSRPRSSRRRVRPSTSAS